MNKVTLKKFIYISITLIVISTALIVFLNIKVTTLQGVNYQVHSIRIPLYLKILNFMDRHYNYKQQVRRIIENENDEQKKVMKIFSWTYHNIRKQPESLPIIDDHAWHIIVRGYGVADQACDVFSTLCNYAGLDAFFDYVYTKGKSERMRLSFVRVNNLWHIFDPYNGVYFVDTTGGLADFTKIQSKNYRMEKLGAPKEAILNYWIYFNNLPDTNKINLKRERVQSPIKRLLYELKK